jgi:hypothetical protein
MEVTKVSIEETPKLDEEYCELWRDAIELYKTTSRLSVQELNLLSSPEYGGHNQVFLAKNGWKVSAEKNRLYQETEQVVTNVLAIVEALGYSLNIPVLQTCSSELILE